MAIVFLIHPGQLYLPPNEITKNTNQSVMTGWLEEKKNIIISGMCEACDMLFAFFSSPPCHKTCDK